MIEFQAAAGMQLTCIHECFLKVHDEATVDVNSVEQWVRQKAATGGERLHNKSQNGCTCRNASQDLPG